MRKRRHQIIIRITRSVSDFQRFCFILIDQGFVIDFQKELLIIEPPSVAVISAEREIGQVHFRTNNLFFLQLKNKIWNCKADRSLQPWLKTSLEEKQLWIQNRARVRLVTLTSKNLREITAASPSVERPCPYPSHRNRMAPGRRVFQPVERRNPSSSCFSPLDPNATSQSVSDKTTSFSYSFYYIRRKTLGEYIPTNCFSNPPRAAWPLCGIWVRIAYRRFKIFASLYRFCAAFVLYPKL